MSSPAAAKLVLLVGELQEELGALRFEFAKAKGGSGAAAGRERTATHRKRATSSEGHGAGNEAAGQLPQLLQAPSAD